MTFHRSALSILAAGLVVGACTPQPSGSSFSRSETMRPQTVQLGTVESVRPVDIRPGQTRVGTVTGAVLGGIAGSQIGGGTASNVAGGVAGAVAGGAIGSAIQGSQNTPGIEITVRLKGGGGRVAIVQPGSPQEFRVGDKVRVIGSGDNTRVSR